MTTSDIDVSDALNRFGGQETDDLEQLERVITRALARPPTEAVDDALLGIFERFPAEDGHGVYWTIIHGLEHRGQYEASLLRSVRRKPVPFNLLMLNRLRNAGSASCAGEDILLLLEAVAASPTAAAESRGEAADFLASHRQKQRP